MFERLKQAGMSAYAKLVDSFADPIVKEVTLVVLSRDDPDEEYKYEVKEYRIPNATNKKITRLFGEVYLTPWSPDFSLETLEKSLCYVQYPLKLEDGQKYVLTHLPISNKLEERTYRKNATKFLEDSAAERAVQLLEEKGYTNVKRYCSLRSGSNFEIDAGAVSKEACILVECKTNITKRTLDHLERTCDLLKSSEEMDFAPFRDRPAFKMVAGAIGGKAKAQVTIHNELERRRIGLFLASGHSLDVGDSCIRRKSHVPTRDTLVRSLVQSICLKQHRYDSVHGKDYFVVIVSEYTFIPWKHSQERTARFAVDDGGGHISSTPSITVGGAATLEAEEVLFLRDKVTSYFTDKLLLIVRDIQRHMTAKKQEFEDPDVHASRKFPELAGSHLPMGEAALQFIKHVCAVLALDQRVQHDVLVLRKNLLKLVKVKEFSAEAVFHDPCLSFTLPNVICSYCNDCRDLDLCRDVALLEHDWRCVMPQCGQPYDREWVENSLLQLVRRRERLFQLQDLVCCKCSQVKSSHVAEQCTCAGAFKSRESPNDFRNRMQVFLNIAVYHGFDLLRECVSWVLEVSPASS